MRRMVGRPRQFDEEEVLDAAMKAFWANGYEGTSLADLVSVTGLHKGSLYQAFGDKHTLFIQTLNRYLQNIRHHKNEILDQADSPLQGIRNVLHGFIDMSEEDADCPHGCMAVKALVEIAPRDPEVLKIMDAHKEGMMESMQRRIMEAQANGELDRNRSPEMIASLIMIFMDGLATQAAGPMDIKEAHALLDGQLDALL